jgi:hypothetical protein
LLNIKSVKIEKKTFYRWKFSNVLLAFVFLNIKSVKIKNKTFYRWKFSNVLLEVLHNLDTI